jgi:hypothetical protein
MAPASNICRFSGSDRISYAPLIAANFSLASGALFTSGWNSFACGARYGQVAGRGAGAPRAACAAEARRAWDGAALAGQGRVWARARLHEVRLLDLFDSGGLGHAEGLVGILFRAQTAAPGRPARVEGPGSRLDRGGPPAEARCTGAPETVSKGPTAACDCGRCGGPHFSARRASFPIAGDACPTCFFEALRRRTSARGRAICRRPSQRRDARPNTCSR